MIIVCRYLSCKSESVNDMNYVVTYFMYVRFRT